MPAGFLLFGYHFFILTETPWKLTPICVQLIFPCLFIMGLKIEFVNALNAYYTLIII